ncbi:MAG: DMT family transporter, partial [Methylococcales bacterium]|nr:DMT family transporter [Methylococcales bacterium]
IVNPFDKSIIANGYFKGCVLASIAACLYAVATLATKSIKITAPYIITLTQLLIGSVMLWPFVQFSILPHTSLQYSSILILGIVHSAFMYMLLYSSYQKLTTSSIAILSYIYPLVAIMVDFIVFDKTLSMLQVVGGLMILASSLCNKLNINPFYQKQALLRT